jgi:hypothetical protein
VSYTILLLGFFGGIQFAATLIAVVRRDWLNAVQFGFFLLVDLGLALFLISR